MWCKCELLSGVNVGCLNIPYSNTPLGGLRIRIKISDDYIDFMNSSIDDVFILIKAIDDNRASVYEKLSITDGGIVVDVQDSTKLSFSVTPKMLDKANNKLYYQMFLKEDNKTYYLMKGEFIYQQNFN